MSYRVTNSMMQTLMLNDMHNNLSKLLDIQQQMSTQRKYQNASDNPLAVTKGMGLETMMTEGEQYISNLQDAISWLKFTDSAMGDMNDLFIRIRELAVKAGDGSLEETDRNAIATELQELQKELMSYANATIGGEYLFAGLLSDTKPFTIGPDGKIQYNGNNYALNWEFSRNETGKVSLTGREVFPENEKTHSLKGIEVPLDFEWTGRSEILEFKVGFQTVKVRIPERWEDEIRNGNADSSDYNRYRDPGEKLEGYSLDEIAELINNSTEMGDVSKLLKAKVVKDLDSGVQYLQIQSLTGEPVRLTGWPETDPEARAEGVKGAAYGALMPPRTAASDGKLTFRFDDNSTHVIDVAAGESLQDIAKKLNAVPDGRIWASYKTDGTNEWIDIVSRSPGESFNLQTTGGVTGLFAPEMATANSSKSGSTQKAESNALDSAMPFMSLSDGKLTIRQGYDVYEIAVPANSNLASVAGAINTSGAPFQAGIDADGKLVIENDPASSEAFSVTAEGGLVPLYSDGVRFVTNQTAYADGKYTLETGMIPTDFAFPLAANSALSFEYDGKKYWVDISACTDLTDVASTLQTALQTVDPTAVVSIEKGLDDDANERNWLRVETQGGPITLSGFGGAADLLGSHTIGSKAIDTNADHTHIGFAAMMGLETALSSTEVPVDAAPWDTVTKPLHLVFSAGKHKAEIFINDTAALTLEELAARINGVCGDWMQAVVEIDDPDGTDPALDPLNNSGDNAEGATKRLVFRTNDGEPLTVYDGPGKDVGTPAEEYAQLLGFNTALKGEASGPLVYPSSAAGSKFDENMPAILEVKVGEKVFQVKVCENNCPTAELVAKSIVRQVNEQYGGTLLAWDANDIAGTPDTGTFALYAVTGEPLRVNDVAYGDPRYTEYTGGIAAQLGIANGLTSSAATQYSKTFGPGLLRISTPGREIDVPVLAGETMHDIANRIRDYAGGWLDVSFSTDSVDDPNGNVTLNLSAKDGSAVSVFDVDGDVAWNMGLDTGLVGTADLLNDWPTLSDDATLTITVNGASHTIDLYDSEGDPAGPTVTTPEELADLINTRFQGQDVRAEVIETKDSAGNVTAKRLAIWSPKGYTFEIDGTGTDTVSGTSIPDVFGFIPGTNAESKSHGGAGPYNQVVAQRTGNNERKTDFFGVMDNLIDTVAGGNVDGISDTLLTQLDTWMANLLKCRAQVGALTSRYSTTSYRLTSDNTNYTELHTNTVGVDLAKVVTDYEMTASIYQASLAAIARIMQPSLLDFLK